MEKRADLFYWRKFFMIPLLCLGFRLNACQDTNVKVGIIYDVSSEISLHLAEEHVISSGSCSTPPQIHWISLNSSNPTASLRKVWFLMRSDIHVLISALRCPQLTSVSAMTETLRIPHLALDIDTCRSSRNETYTLHMADHFYYLQKLIADITELERWNKVVLIVNSTIVRLHTKHIVQELSMAGVETVLWDGVVRKKKIWTDQQNIIFITNNRSSFQQTMVNLTDLTPGHRYVVIMTERDVTNTDMMQMTSFLPENSLLIRTKVQCSRIQTLGCCTCTFLKRQLMAIIRLATCSSLDTETLITKVPTVTHMGGTDISTADHLLDQILQNLQHIRESDNKVRYGIKYDCSKHFEILKLAPANNWIPFGKWTSTGRLTNFTDNRRSVIEDFGGITLRLGVIGAIDPFSHLNVGEDGSYQGLVIDVLNHVAMSLNFRYVLVKPVDGYYGSQLDNGTWTGVINMIQRQEVVFGAGLFTMTVERARVVDFTVPFMESSFAILTSIPNEQAKLFQFLKPFSRNVWVLILVFVITTCIVLISIIWLTEYKNKPDAKMFSPQDIVCDVIASFLEQGVPSYPSSTSGRCLLTLWFFFSLLMMTIYTANLAAVLTVSAPVKPINSLKDLSERADLDVIVLDGSSSWTLFEFSKEPIHQKIFKRIVASTTLEDTVQRVLSGKACYISDLTYLHYIVALTCGQVRIAEEKFQHQFFAFPIQKNSILKKPIDSRLQVLMEVGIIESIMEKWLHQPTHCNTSLKEEVDVSQLKMDRIGGVFLVLAIFVSLAIMSCVVKLMYIYTTPYNHA